MWQVDRLELGRDRETERIVVRGVVDDNDGGEVMQVEDMRERMTLWLWRCFEGRVVYSKVLLCNTRRNGLSQSFALLSTRVPPVIDKTTTPRWHYILCAWF